MTRSISTDVIFEIADTSADQVTGRIFLVIEGDEYQATLETLGLTFDSSEDEILTTIRPIIQEVFNIDIMRNGGWLYKTRKATNTQNIHIIPNSTAGVMLN